MLDIDTSLWWLDAQEVVIGEEAAKSGENVFVGGENRWK